MLEGCWVGDAVARWREAAESVGGECFAAEQRCGRSAESEKAEVGKVVDELVAVCIRDIP